MVLECPGICRLVNTMKSSIPYHKLEETICEFTAAQHFACFQRELHSLGRLASGLRGGGTTDHLLQYGDLPQLRRGGRWTSERTPERYVQEGTSCSTTTDSSKRLQTAPLPSQSSPRASWQNKNKVPPPALDACFLERYLHHSVRWHKNNVQVDDVHDTSVLRLTRVRAQQQARNSVSRVCIGSHVRPSRPQATCSEERTPFCAALRSRICPGSIGLGVPLVILFW